MYDDPGKVTYDASRFDEYRLMDVALVVLRGKLPTLVYMEIGDDVRVISFRHASRESANSMKKTSDTSKPVSETDWERVIAHAEGDAIPYEPEDGPYDPNDAAAARAWLARADAIAGGRVVRRGKRGPQKAPTKKLVSLRLSQEVIEHFKAGGPGWQTRIERTLVEAMKRGA